MLAKRFGVDVLGVVKCKAGRMCGKTRGCERRRLTDLGAQIEVED
jgi:hypothetical protein